MTATLHYVHDPMCSWCWAFRPASDALFEHLDGSIHLATVLGGLAPDSDVPMPAELAVHLQQTWRHIQSVVPGTRFDFDFWSNNVPKRSTWRACRAVLIADALGDGRDGVARSMTDAIQRAYYLRAMNPSERDVLQALAIELGLDGEAFAARLDDACTQLTLDGHFAEAARLGAQGFPGLFLETAEGALSGIPVDFASSEPMRRRIDGLMQAA